MSRTVIGAEREREREEKKLFSASEPTNQPTNQTAKQPTNQPMYFLINTEIRIIKVRGISVISVKELRWSAAPQCVSAIITMRFSLF